jgi:hypothetical protein
MIRSDSRRKQQQAPVHWDDLPHARLSTEIAQSVAYRSSHEAHYELQLQELAMRLPTLCQENHLEYTRLISAEINRELRICRDVYRKHLETLNNKSRTAKWSVALDLAVALRASEILRREICEYLRRTNIETWIVEIFLAHNIEVSVPMGNGKLRGQNTREPSLAEVVRLGVADGAFQYLKARFKKESFMVGGRFAEPYVLRSAMSYRFKGEDISMLYDASEIWLSQAGKMWDNVLHEIIAQQVQIDLEERSDAMAAVGVLSQFDRMAGPLYAEASERYTTIPDRVWKVMGAKIDHEGISLEETLEPEGKKVLRDLARRKICIGTWEEAVGSDSDFGILESKTVVGGTVKYRGMLSRHAKRAFYRSRDKYYKVLESVLEKRVYL